MRQRADLPFAMEEYERRMNRVRHEMVKKGLDVLMVTGPENIFYLTGFETTGYVCYQALFIPLDAEPFMITRILEETGVQALSWIEITRPYRDDEDPWVHTRDVLEEFQLHTKRIGYERDSWFFTRSQQEQCFNLCSQAAFIDCSGLIEGLRVIKSEPELEKIREAARYAETAVRVGIETTEAGITDNSISASMHYAMIKAGSDPPAVPPYIATGPRSAIGHATWSGRTLRIGDCVFLEPAGCKHRYHAACMRTGFIGDPTPSQREAEKIVKEAVEAMVDRIRAGAVAAEVDAVARRIIGSNKIGLQQRARSAYSIGLAFAPGWDEGAIFSCHPGETRILRENMVFHLIPWGLVPGQFAMGLSETIRVTKTGCEVLTNLPREVFVKAPVRSLPA
ncbi:Xaa-Pro dipeptidase [Melghirimyces profundicolus]|uniref:Xaa-Pro dipeptidase n=1 Tax=Melghirimyces profundicolus TaxID=1242148 RepID=A0A2T6B1B6_9BACL|nr:M24 family metallopeptidase [Melghirimyces profundicolus]PTX49812.1 Xaa-Pro dipeptidase [Melghirimyces profundicolus]